MLSIIGGLVSIVVSILWIVPENSFGYALDDVLVVLKGSVALGLVFGGLIAIAAGISAMKEKSQDDKDFASRIVSNELNNLGDSVSNITHTMSSLIKKKFVIQTRKAGSSKQAQK